MQMHPWILENNGTKACNFTLSSESYLKKPYKIDEDEFIDFNIIFTIIGFSIYQAFYMSEQRTN